MTHPTKNRIGQGRAVWGLACLGMVALYGIAAAGGSGEGRVEVAGVLLLPVILCFVMATPISSLSDPRKWGRTAAAASVTAMVAVMPACSKLTAVPIFQRGAIEAGETIPLPIGTTGVRIGLRAGLMNRQDAVARVVLGIGAETTEVVFRPHFVHARVGGRSSVHVAIREPIVEEVWLAVSDRTPMQVVALSGDLDGPVGLEVFAEALTPGTVLLLSVLVLVVVTLVDRSLGLPRNAVVAAGAALGFGSLVYWKANPETLGSGALAPLAGGLIAGVGAGSLIRWLLSSNRGGARRTGPR